MALRIFTCIHGRHKVTRAFFKHLHFLRYQTGHKLPVTFGYSRDEDLTNIEDLLMDGDQPVKAPNIPLSEKHNIAMDELIKKTHESHVLHLGSDDFAKPEYIDFASDKKIYFAGVQSIYFADLGTQKAKVANYFDNVRQREYVLGAGRIYSRDMLKKTIGQKYRDYKGNDMYVPEGLVALLRVSTGLTRCSSRHGERCALWTRHVNKGLDNNATKTLSQLGYEPELFEFEKPQITDVKSGENITDFFKIKGKEVPFQEAMKLVSCEI